jgi:two-component system chemotaxis sensor kinase CheA
MDGEQGRLVRRRITFVRDARQRLVTLDACLLALERDPDDRSALQGALQALHTIKGNAGLVGLPTLGITAHALEEALVGVAALSDPASRHSSLALLRRGLDALCAMVAIVADTLDRPAPPIPVVEALRTMHPDLQAAPVYDVSPFAAVRPRSPSAHVAPPVDRLDRLLELVEELASSQGAPMRASAEAPNLALGRQRRLLRELRVAVLQARLLPIAYAFDGFDRLVHDLAERLGRQARLSIEGADTEVDRAVLEPIRGLVVHLVRNALVHGLEPPDERLAAKKPAAGTIRLVVRPELDGVSLEVSDDGRGLDRQQVAAGAVALGLCAPRDAAEMADAQLWMFLLHPGFSTHAGVDQVAGRGVGLSAVGDAVQALRGRIEIASRAGAGTTVRLLLPSMLALDEVVLIRVGAETYAIPQSSVERVCSAKETDGLTVVDLWSRLQVPGDSVPDERVLIVCHRAGGQVGLLADGVLGRGEQAIRPLPRKARQPELLGAYVADGGQVVLVLDVERL